MDVERITTELYGLAPERFVAARDAYVAEAREAKDTKAAKAIAGLRRPTLAAWVANHLARERPEEAEALLTLGRTLREAHRTLDAPQLREAGRRQHQVTAALAREAAALARDAGQPVSEAVLREVTEILHAVLADPEAGERWVAGRLVRAPEPVVGFGAVAADAEAVARRPTSKAPSPRKKATGPRGKTGQPDDARLRRARKAAREADTAARERAAALDTARRARDDARRAADEASGRVSEAEEELRAARREQRTARTAATSADKAAREAERSADTARRAAEEAARAVEAAEAEAGEAARGGG
ncbi:hypothetical protein [Streptomyces sp. NPDC058745]|uniref:hypothetical protein n=1 Tax=Streptomyces sp. NPDC058745 TaxID=3346621 RepID=UPI0036B76EB5